MAQQPTAMYITTKVRHWLKEVAMEHDVTQEGLLNVLLTLSLSDERVVKQALEVIQRLGLGGTTDMQNKGW